MSYDLFLVPLKDSSQQMKYIPSLYCGNMQGLTSQKWTFILW